MIALSGQHLREGRRRIIITTLHFLVLTYWLVVGMLKPIMHHSGFIGWVGSFETTSQFVQVSICFLYFHFINKLSPIFDFKWTTKIMVCKYYRTGLVKLFKDMHEFWPLDSFDKKTEHKLKKRCRYITNMVRIYIWSGFVTVCLMNTQPLFTIGKTWEFPVPVYWIVDFSKIHYYMLAYLTYLIQSYPSLFFIIGFDCLFMTLLISASHQLSLLKTGLRNLKFDTRAEAIMSYGTLRKYIKHHVFILS